jgi:hypothetical protein
VEKGETINIFAKWSVSFCAPNDTKEEIDREERGETERQRNITRNISKNSVNRQPHNTINTHHNTTSLKAIKATIRRAPRAQNRLRSGVESLKNLVKEECQCPIYV